VRVLLLLLGLTRVDAGTGSLPTEAQKIDLQDLTPDEMQDIHNDLLNATGQANLSDAERNDTLAVVLDAVNGAESEATKDDAIINNNNTKIEIPLKGTQSVNDTVELDALAPEAAPPAPGPVSYTHLRAHET